MPKAPATPSATGQWQCHAPSVHGSKKARTGVCQGEQCTATSFDVNLMQNPARPMCERNPITRASQRGPSRIDIWIPTGRCLDWPTASKGGCSACLWSPLGPWLVGAFNAHTCVAGTLDRQTDSASQYARLRGTQPATGGKTLQLCKGCSCRRQPHPLEAVMGHQGHHIRNAVWHQAAGRGHAQRPSHSGGVAARRKRSGPPQRPATLRIRGTHKSRHPGRGSR